MTQEQEQAKAQAAQEAVAASQAKAAQDAKASQSKARAKAKATVEAVVTGSWIPAKANKEGAAYRCQVITKLGQCGNPARHDHTGSKGAKGGWTCSTHHNVWLRNPLRLWSKGIAPLQVLYVSPTEQAKAAEAAMAAKAKRG